MSGWHPGLRERYEELMADCGAPVCQQLRDSYHRAAKAHVCTDCRGTIAPGDRYRLQFWLIDGEAHFDKTCTSCLNSQYGE